MWQSSPHKAQTFVLKIFYRENCFFDTHNTMSDGKGEALASELAALSVEETSAPPDGDGEKPSAEPAEGTDKGEKIKGVVSWFNVAKGFGARASSFQRGIHLLFPSARSRGAPRARAARARRARRRSRCLGVLFHPLCAPGPSTRALARRRIRPSAS